MRMKGRTEITLTDINTGEVKVIDDSNMVTNAVRKIFETNIEGMLYNGANSTTNTAWTNNLTPICGYAMGGILLFSESLIEDSNNIYAPDTNFCTGYANMLVNSTADELRGSLNLSESGIIENGYKYVWDFSTNQANGTISAIALTHRLGGASYLGSKFDNSSKLLELRNNYTSLTGEIASWYLDVVEINFEGNYFISISINRFNEILIKRVRKCFTQIGLNFSLSENGDELLESITITPSIFSNPDAASNLGYLDFMDGEDGYWYGFIGKKNSSGSNNIKWIKINKIDYSFTEGIWTLSNIRIDDVGYRAGYAEMPTRRVHSVIRNGYLYVMKYDKTGMYKINVSSSADITEVPFGFTSKLSLASNYGYTYVYRLLDTICGSDFIILSNDTVNQTADLNPLNYTSSPLFQYGPYGITFGRYFYAGTVNRIHKGLWLITPYLATINNLSTGIVKSADKTMKITYTINEVK